MKKIAMILALDEKNGLGKGGDLAWRISADMKHFKKITTEVDDDSKKNAVIMGRKTWDSISEKYRPLPDRVNVVLSRKFDREDSKGNLCLFNDFERALEVIGEREDVETLFIIGGAEIYNQTIQKGLADTMYLTRVAGNYDCDVFVDDFEKSFELIEESGYHDDGKHKYTFEIYKKLLTSNHKRI